MIAMFSTCQSFMQITSIDASDLFIHYIPFPKWFKQRFQPAFDDHRRKTDGVLFLIKNEDLYHPNEVITGCIYVETVPIHQSYGKSIPIFGWLFANDEESCQALLEKAEEYVRSEGYTKLRGPINEPHLFGGWGLMAQEYPSMPNMVDALPYFPQLSYWLYNAQYYPNTTYCSLEIKDVAPFQCSIDMTKFEFISPPMAEILANPSLLAEIQALADRNFSRFLPDTNPQKLHDVLPLLMSYEHSEDFYIFLREKATGRIIAAVFEIPNFFEQWQNLPITSSDVNAMIVDKEYRNQMVIYLTYSHLQQKLQKRGIIREIGVSVWKKNLPAMRAFLKSAEIVAEYTVYQKKLS